MADTQADPVFQIQRIYLKELSLEQPNSPAIMLEQAQPQVDIQLAVGSEQVAEGVYEASVTATVHTKVGEKTVFLVEAKQAGIFEIRNLPDDQMGPVLGMACPRSSIPTCAAMWPIRSSARVFPRSIWPRSISRPSTSSSWSRPRPPAPKTPEPLAPERPAMRDRFAP